MPENPAEKASRIALEQVFTAIDERQSFRLEAGAGAGKTYSLVKSLQFLIEQRSRELKRNGQKIACITYTNVAKDEIENRVDKHPAIHCDTNHAFCWSLISGFQPKLRELIQTIPAWTEKLEQVEELADRTVKYTLGYRSVREDSVHLHHDDIIPLTISLMSNDKFRSFMAARYPIILIDEYQDTDAKWIEAIKEHFLGKDASPLFGFFGDHWQKIYGDGCGKLEHEAVREIGKEANFRSVQLIVDKLNLMRPELPQFVEDPELAGDVQVFHTNGWQGERRTGGHWAGDLPEDAARSALAATRASLQASGWLIEPERTKILMLTHRALASEQGYPSLPSVFAFNESFTRKENPYISYLVDVLEPACDAFQRNHFGQMFEALGSSVPLIRRTTDKARWSESMNALLALREAGTVGDVLAHLKQTKFPRLPDAVLANEIQLDGFDKEAGEEMPRPLAEAEKLRPIAYPEIKALKAFLDGSSPFETKHGVKGAEFENVLVVVGRGWNLYNFNQMLELASEADIPDDRIATFERNRNLFYVACSRPKTRLAILFTQALSENALATIHNWFGADATNEIAF